MLNPKWRIGVSLKLSMKQLLAASMLLDGEKLSRSRLLSSAIENHKRLPEQFSLSLKIPSHD